MDTSAPLEVVRLVKQKVLEAANRTTAHVTGAGITRVNGKYAVKVNLRERYTPAGLPHEIDGVVIVYETTGPVHTLKETPS